MYIAGFMTGGLVTAAGVIFVGVVLTVGVALYSCSHPRLG